MIFVRLVVGAGEAKSGPPVGPMLAQYYVNLVEFRKDFNSESSKKYEQSVPIKVHVFVEERKYEFFLRRPTISFLFFQLFFFEEQLLVEQLYDIVYILCSLEIDAKGNIDVINLNKKACMLFGFPSSLGSKYRLFINTERVEVELLEKFFGGIIKKC